MSENLPAHDSEDEGLIEESAPQTPTFFAKNRVLVSIVSLVLVAALGTGIFIASRPSPAQPYLDKVCAAFAGLDIGETSNNEAKALISAQQSNIDLANRLDAEAAIEVDAAFEEFSDFADQVGSTNFSLALAVTLKNYSRLTELLKQIDEDSALGESAVATMDTACGRE
jgi:hypothetical protein